MNKFKVQGIGLDTTTIRFNPSIQCDFSYIRTSISANNDYLIGDFVKKMIGEPPLITSVEFLDGLTYVLPEHLNLLGRKGVDLLLINSTCKFNETDLDHISESLKLVNHFGIEDPESVDRLKEICEKFDKNYPIEYVCINISPLEFNHDIIQYCSENHIRIIGKNPLGGYLSGPRNTMAFSIPYLLGFCSYYSDIVLVSGRDLIYAENDRNFISDLFFGKEASPLFILKKNINKQVRGLKKAIYTSLEVQGLDMTVPYDSPEDLFSGDIVKFKIGSYIEKVDNINKKVVSRFGIDELAKSQDEIAQFMNKACYPSDGDRRVKMAVARYKATEYLRILFPEKDGWELDYARVGTSMLLLILTKPQHWEGKFIWKRLEPTKTRQYYLVLDKSENIILKEVVLSEEEDRKVRKELESE